MSRYDTDLFEAMNKQIAITSTFAKELFTFLDVLHEDAGMFHGDIKPENICMNVGINGGDLHSWALIDWESARTHGATFVGPYTPDYMPPCESPSASGDVYSAAVTLLVAHNRKPPTAVREMVEHLPVWWTLFNSVRVRPTAKEAAELPWEELLTTK